MNAAVIVGNAQYRKLRNLPACRLDCLGVHEILAGSGKYDKILLLESELRGSEALEKLEAFISNLVDVGELFFYYSGHGGVHGGEYCFLWNDYDPQDPDRGCLAQSRLDDLLTRAGAEVTVKVIDACYSGTSYVGKGVSGSTLYYKTCYFLSSSQPDERSFSRKEGDYSYFTASFIQADLTEVFLSPDDDLRALIDQVAQRFVLVPPD